MSSRSQSIPCSKFSPETALHQIICQWCVFMLSNSKIYTKNDLKSTSTLIKLTSLISSAVQAPGRSCLFANTSKVAPDSRLKIALITLAFKFQSKLTSSFKSTCNSARQSSNRHRSALSTTQINPSVHSK